MPGLEVVKIRNAMLTSNPLKAWLHEWDRFTIRCHSLKDLYICLFIYYYYNFLTCYNHFDTAPWLLK